MLSKSVCFAKIRELFIFLCAGITVLFPSMRTVANEVHAKQITFDELKSELFFCLEEKGDSDTQPIYNPCTAMYRNKTTPVVTCRGPDDYEHNVLDWKNMNLLLSDDPSNKCKRKTNPQSGIIRD